MCDGTIDCPSGHDELNCPNQVECPADMVQCSAEKKICIPKSAVCDGINNCGMYEDEQNCCGRVGFLRFVSFCGIFVSSILTEISNQHQYAHLVEGQTCFDICHTVMTLRECHS